VLSTDGHEVRQAEAVNRALEEIAKSAPEVILLDLALPGTDGLALARLLKADPQKKHIVVIAVTAYPERYSKTQALAAGCDAYIEKPINTRKLTEQVFNVVEKLK
jgi:two-component system cell cycle response regulator